MAHANDLRAHRSTGIIIIIIIITIITTTIIKIPKIYIYICIYIDRGKGKCPYVMMAENGSGWRRCPVAPSLERRRHNPWFMGTGSSWGEDHQGCSRDAPGMLQGCLKDAGVMNEWKYSVDVWWDELNEWWMDVQLTGRVIQSEHALRRGSPQ